MESNDCMCVDVGNSTVKWAVFVEECITQRGRCKSADELLKTNFGAQQYYQRIIICSSVRLTEKTIEKFGEHCAMFTLMNRSTPVPITNLYATPETLGADRLAAAVGAASLREGQNVLVVDFGTAITFDVITAKGEFLGGNIALGARSRLRALNILTDRLPLCELQEPEQWIGRTTQEAIVNGVYWGICSEIEGYMHKMEEQFGQYATIFTGGDAIFFEKRYKNTIFAELDLTLIGLKRIIDYNAEKQTDNRHSDSACNDCLNDCSERSKQQY